MMALAFSSDRWARPPPLIDVEETDGVEPDGAGVDLLLGIAVVWL